MIYNPYVDEDELVAHVKRICRRNLKTPAKICLQCPFIKIVVPVMRENGWEYAEEINKRAFPVQEV